MTDLKQLRMKAGLLQQEVANKVDVSVNTIQNWESGRVLPKGDNLKHYLNAVGITDPTEMARIAGELATASYSGEGDDIDNAPYFLFPEDSAWITKIRECKASAEELDMLGYEAYIKGQWKLGHRVRMPELNYPMEFVFFERYGGFNATMKKMHDARTRLDKFYEDALEYAKNNPGREYKLVSFSQNEIVDKIQKIIGAENFNKEVGEKYHLLKAIECADIIYANPSEMGFRSQKAEKVNSILRYTDPYTGERNFGCLKGYISLELPDPQAVPSIHTARLTERGKELIKWFEYRIKQGK